MALRSPMFLAQSVCGRNSIEFILYMNVLCAINLRWLNYYYYYKA